MGSAPFSPLRVLHVAFSVGVSGSSRYICDLAERQLAAGHAVGVALPRRRPGGSIYDALPAGIDVLSLLDGMRVLGLWRAISAFKPDILHFHDGLGPRSIRWIPGHPPSVITLHLGYKRSMRSVDGLVRIARWQSVGDYRGKVVTVANWRTASVPVPPAQARQLRDSIGATPDRFLIGCVKRMDPRKGGEILIDAIRGLEAPQLMAVFIGDGPERADLEARAGGDPRILFLGHRSDVDAWYGAFDAFVTPSYAEHSPLVVLEAMDAGLPIAAAANAGHVEMLDGQPGQLFALGDSQGLMAILKGWLAAPPQRLTYDLSAFQPGHAADRIEDFYRQVIAARGRR